jgi:uncharacterized protein
MNFDLQTALQALAGGALIGLASALLLLLQGRIAGVSGAFKGLLVLDAGPGGWRAGFIGGLLVAGVVAALSQWVPPPPVVGSWGLALVAGALTGVGAGLANGCTSGHGVCGLSNLSLRSGVAIAIFMLAAGLTVYAARHLVGL